MRRYLRCLWLGLATAPFLLAGCAKDKCEGLEAQAQIRVTLEGLSKASINRTAVILAINGGRERRHQFLVAEPSFVFKFGKANAPPGTLVIRVEAFDDTDAIVGTGELSTRFSPDGCNDLSVTVKARGTVNDGGPEDAMADDSAPGRDGPDGPAPDGPGPDGLNLEGGGGTPVDVGPPDPCGNGQIDPGEKCDGAKLDGETCVTQGFEGGTLGCSVGCESFDTEGCYKCGDGIINTPDEQCDGTNLDGATCASLGCVGGGTLACNSECKHDVNGCSQCLCGNGIMDASEECDGSEFGGNTCQNEGFDDSGSLACNSDCTLSHAKCRTTGFVAISAGSFTMGSPSDESCRDSDETQHSVTLTNAFEMQAIEVTQSKFEGLRGYNPSHNFGCPSCPVESVAWHEAAAYCNALSEQRGLGECYSCSGSGASVSCDEASRYSGIFLYDCPGYRLPTEAEWEYAYRAGTTTAYYNGTNSSDCGYFGKCPTDTNLDAIGWYCKNSFLGTQAGGLKLANLWGLYDMAGNVLEWCNDWYIDTLADETDPVGPSSGTDRVIRGGSYLTGHHLNRAAYRTPKGGLWDRNVGFRCVRTITL